MIVKRGDTYVVTTESGRVLGTHDTRAEAVEQLRAVEASKARRAKQGREMNKRLRGT